MQHFPPEVVESTTGVPAETVRNLARRICGADGAAPVMYTGLEYSDSGVQAIRAVLTLFALAGQLDVPGGIGLAMRGSHFPINHAGVLPNPDLERAVARDRSRPMRARSNSASDTMFWLKFRRARSKSAWACSALARAPSRSASSAARAASLPAVWAWSWARSICSRNWSFSTRSPSLTARLTIYPITLAEISTLRRASTLPVQLTRESTSCRATV